MRRMYLLFVVICYFFLVAGLLFADVPHLISYQGRLTDGVGTPLVGVHNITFNLYTVPTGGLAIWMETQTVAVSTEGLYNVMLGSIASLSSIDFSQQYWLGISVDGGAEICRYEFGASPYALNIADTVLQASGYVFTDGTTRGCMAQSGLSLESGETLLPTRDAVALYGYGNNDVGLYARSNLWEGIIGYSTGDDGVQGVSTSGSYAGVLGINTSGSPVEGYLAYNGYGLYTPNNAYISQYLQLGGITSHPAAGEGKIYYNSVDKTAYLFDGAVWQDLLGGGSGGVTGIQANANPYLTGDVTLQEGTNVTLSQVGNTITVNSSGSTPLWNDGGTYIEANNNTAVKVHDAGEMFAFQVNGDVSTGASIYGNHVSSGAGERYGVMGSCGSLPSGSGTNYGVKGSATGGTINYAVYGDVGGNTGYGVYGTGGAGKPWGYLGGQDYGVYGEGSVSGSASLGDAVGYFKNTVTTSDAAAVYAECENTPYYGYGGCFRGGYIGVKGYATIDGTGDRYGVYGTASSGNDENFGVMGSAVSDSLNYGVYGSAWNGLINYGVYGTSGSGITNWAGYFDGNVNIVGTISKGGGSFLIDHPLDPLNKTLRHNFVESPENLCMYRGKVALDSDGKGIIEMPDYFTALTKENEASINLTPVGIPFLTGAEWNEGFTAVTIFGEPNREVYYIVLADRDDPVMHQLYHPVEEEKGDGNFTKGKLLYPEAYGYPEEMDENYHHDKQKPDSK